MNKFFVIVGHTFFNRVKSKSYVITTLIMMALIFALTNIQSIIETFQGDEQKQVLIITENESWYQQIEQWVSENEDITVESFTGNVEEAENLVEEEEATAFVEITETADGLPQATYYADQIANTSISEPIQQALQQVKVSTATERADISTQLLQQISSPVTFEMVALEESAKTAEELNQTRGVVYVMLFFLYFSVIMYGNMISTEVATEKSSRVMEILISSVSPVTQMFGKITGIALLGITQFALFSIVGYIGIQQSEAIAGEESMLQFFGFTDIPVSTMIYAAVFFILGYLLYATLAATLGSLVSRLEDAQQMMAPMMMLIVLAFMLAIFGLATPDAGYVKVTSFIPFFTPLLMFLRVGMLEIPVWEVALSIGILIASIVALGIIGARIYRGGVLMYGKSSSLKDIKRAIQLSKKEG